MKRNEYSASAVKHSFWFMEFRKVIALLSEGYSLDEIKEMNAQNNIFGAPTQNRSKQIWNTVSARVKTMDASFYPVFQSCDITSQKMFALIATMAYDTLFGEFVYEVLREKLIIGNDELSDGDIRIFFKNKQEQSDKVANWTDETISRLGICYKTMLAEAGLAVPNQNSRKIIRPILNSDMEKWLENHDMNYYFKAIEGVR